MKSFQASTIIQLVLATLLSVNAGTGICGDDMDSRFEEARKLYYKGDMSVISVFEEGAKKEHIPSLRLLAYIMDYAEENERAYELYNQAAKLDDNESAYRLSSLYHQGEGTKKDIQQAQHWLLMAANNGHAKAMETLGNAYEVGDYGLQKDTEKAIEWYLKAKQAGINVKARIKRLTDISAAEQEQQVQQARELEKARKSSLPVAVTPEMMEVQTMINAWADAWVAGDANAVMSHYADTFVTPAGQVRSDWESRQRKSIQAAAVSKITLEQFKIKVHDKERAQAAFVQKQQTEKGVEEKKRFFRLIREHGTWKIQTAR